MVAFVQRPAPAFKAEVVNKNAFSEVSLSDFRGKWWVPGASILGSAHTRLPRVVLLFYPM